MITYYKQFDKMVFLGSPGAATDILKLQDTLRECINEIGDLQQSPQGAAHPLGEPDGWEKEYAEGWQIVRDMVSDIAMGLTGQEITFVHPPERTY